MQQHVKVVAILSIIFGGLTILAGLFVGGIIGLGAGITAHSGDTDAAWITGTVAAVIGGILVVLGLPSVIGGWGLLKFRNWARILIIIVAILSLPGIPIGTAYGIYALWALLTADRNLFT